MLCWLPERLDDLIYRIDPLYKDERGLEKSSDYIYIFEEDNEILKDDLEHCMRIPMTDNVRSLNLSNCVAICTYEVLRQQDYPNLLRTEPFKGEDYITE